MQFGTLKMKDAFFIRGFISDLSVSRKVNTQEIE